MSSIKEMIEDLNGRLVEYYAQKESLNHYKNEDKEQLLELVDECIKATKESLLSFKKAELINRFESENEEHVTEQKEIRCGESYEAIIPTMSGFPMWMKVNINSKEQTVIGGEACLYRVFIETPMYRSQMRCYYFNNNGSDNGNCSPETCKYSHGILVKMKDIREIDSSWAPSRLELGSKCLAVFKKTGLWMKAILEEVISEKEYVVEYIGKEKYKDILNESEIVKYPESLNEGSGSEVENNLVISENDGIESDNDDDDSYEEEYEVAEAFFINPEENEDEKERLGIWEKHTNGFGSKILAKFGFKPGKGLGKNSEGRVLPVIPVILGNKKIGLDLTKAAKLKNEQKNKKEENNDGERMFQFLNSKLFVSSSKSKMNDLASMVIKVDESKDGNNRDTSSGRKRLREERKQIASKSKRSEKSLRSELIGIHRERKALESEISKTKESYKRNVSEPQIEKIFGFKLQEHEKKLAKLIAFEKSLECKISLKRKHKTTFKF